MKRMFSVKHFMIPTIKLCVAMITSEQIRAESRKYVMLVDTKPTAMIYKRGMFLNKWVPYDVDGFYKGNPMSFRDFSRQFYVEDRNPAYKLEVFRSTSGDSVSCRISSRNTSKGKSLQFYRGSGEAREYLVMDDSEDCLKFDCREE